jgi:hypothetical protein
MKKKTFYLHVRFPPEQTSERSRDDATTIQAMGELFGPGQPLDASKYYVILPISEETRGCPHGHLRMTRGRCGSLLLHRGGLAPPTPCRSPGALTQDPNRTFP